MSDDGKADVERGDSVMQRAQRRRNQERDRLRARVSELEALSDAPAVATEIDRLLTRILDVQEDAARAQQERDRLRRELEEWKRESEYDAARPNESAYNIVCRIKRILRGES